MIRLLTVLTLALSYAGAAATLTHDARQMTAETR